MVPNTFAASPVAGWSLSHFVAQVHAYTSIFLAQMRTNLSIIFPILVLRFVLGSAAYATTMKRGAQSAGLIIRAKSGVFEGFKSSNTVRCWKGIPYAEAPTGDLRFKAPQKAANRHTESAFSAKTFSPSCPSYGSAAGSGTVFEEDCLTLNIWSPASISSGNLVAVMIYFTGVSI